MALWSRREEKKDKGPVLAVLGLDVYYGRAHALQDVAFTLDHGVLGIVGRNGMGKTTLCNAITGLVPATGSVRLLGEEVLGLAPHEVTRRGIAYVPQGRRVWPSLSVDETLRLVAKHRREVERVYTLFPRLAERKGNGGAQLSGGEQQMLDVRLPWAAHRLYHSVRWRSRCRTGGRQTSACRPAGGCPSWLRPEGDCS